MSRVLCAVPRVSPASGEPTRSHGKPVTIPAVILIVGLRDDDPHVDRERHGRFLSSPVTSVTVPFTADHRTSAGAFAFTW